MIAKLLRLQWRLRGKTMDELRRLPEMTNPRRLAAMRIGTRIGGAAMFTEPHLLTLMTLHAVEMTTRHGHCPISLTSYAAYGMILAEALDRPEQGRRFGRLAMDLTRRLRAREMEGRVSHIYNGLVRHWKEPIGNCLEPLHESFQMCLENGDFEFAAHAVCVRMLYAFESGMHLEYLNSELESSNEALKPLNQGHRLHMLDNLCQRLVEAELLRITGEDFEAHSRMVAQIIATALEFAGAQRGLLLLRGPDRALYIEAEASVDGDSARILQSLPINLRQLSRTVVTYVARTRESLVIHDAQQPGGKIPGLSQEPYIREQEVRSILCLPILMGSRKETELIGMLYLENNRATDVFTRERFETLELICLSAAGRLELSRKAVVDGLTELFNHEYFQNLLAQEIATAQRHSRDLSLIFIDIDHFKDFNDTWGHQVGDQVLREIAGIIKDACRVEDTVARYGGEEIAVILPMTGPGQAGEVAERIRAAVENHRVMHDGNALQVTISLGLAHLEAALADKDELISRADDALYRSKAGGRNRLTAA